jgi:hypothetical protein
MLTEWLYREIDLPTYLYRKKFKEICCKVSRLQSTGRNHWKKYKLNLVYSDSFINFTVKKKINLIVKKFELNDSKKILGKFKLIKIKNCILIKNIISQNFIFQTKMNAKLNLSFFLKRINLKMIYENRLYIDLIYSCQEKQSQIVFYGFRNVLATNFVENVIFRIYKMNNFISTFNFFATYVTYPSKIIYPYIGNALTYNFNSKYGQYKYLDTRILYTIKKQFWN